MIASSSRVRLVPFTLACVALTPLVLPAAGCASSRRANESTAIAKCGSDWRAPINSQRFDEHLVFKVIERDREEAHSLVAAVPLILGAVKIALPLIQKVIRNEGAKFDATSSITAFAPMAVERSALSAAARPALLADADYFILRLVDIPKTTFDKLPAEEQEAWEKLRLGSASANAALRALVPDDARQEVRSEWTPAVQQNECKTRFLAFAGVGRISRAEGNEEFHITLSKYVFTARKAKALTGLGSKFDKRDDRLVISLTPPQGLTAAAGGAFGASMAFSVALAKNSVDVTSADQTSPPIAVPPFKTWTLTASLAETSDFKAALERLAEQVGKLDPEALVQKLQ